MRRSLLGSIRKKFWPNGAAILSILLACTLIQRDYLGRAWHSPKAFFAYATGDGLKNFFTADYYLRYDEGLHFTGLNYPYGEHIVYTDNQPLLLLLLNAIDDHVIDIKDLLPSILLGAMTLLGYLCALTLFALLRRFGTGLFVAAAGACLLTYLSPQLHRVGGHYALYYPFFVFSWYFAVRLYESRKPWGWWLALVALGTLTGMIHLYHPLLQMFFCGSLALVGLLRRLVPWRVRLLGALRWLGAALLPMFFLMGFMALTDMVADRPVAPGSIYLYISHIKSVLFPNFGPMKEVWNTVIKLGNPETEGWGYIGISGAICLLFTGMRLIGRLLRLRWRAAARLSTNQALNDSTWAAIIVLLFACAVPFQLGLDFLLDWVPKLRQFRSLGRLAWVFFYVFGVFAVHYFFLLYKILSRKKLAAMGASLMVFALLGWALDTHQNVRHTHASFKRMKYNADLDTVRFADRLALRGIQPETYQAILPLPYYHVGTEKFAQPQGMTVSFWYSATCATQTGLPLVADFLSRTSISQSLNLLQLFSAPPLEKRILADFPNRKPLLVVSTTEALLPYEAAILRHARLLYEDQTCRMYHLELDAFASTADSLRRAYAQQAEPLSSPWGGLYLDDFSSKKTYAGITGPGAHFWDTHEKIGTTLFDDTLRVNTDSVSELEISVWAKVDYRLYGMPSLACTPIDGAGNRLKDTLQSGSLSVDVWRDWVRISVCVRPAAPLMRYEIKMYSPQPATADRLLIRPLNRDIWQKESEKWLWWNNYPVEL